MYEMPHRNRQAPSSPSYPFQYVVGDYFSIAGNNYLVLGDRFSGWLSIYTAGRGEFDAKSLVAKSRDYFTFQKKSLLSHR